MADAAERLSDALTRHQIDLERLKAGTARKLARLLRDADRDMVEALSRRLDSFGETGTAAARKRKSLKRLTDAILTMRREQWRGIKEETLAQLIDFGKFEGAWQASALEKAIAIEGFVVAGLTATEIRAIITSDTFEGRTVREHIDDTIARDLRNVRIAITQGIQDGRSRDEILRSIVGTRTFPGITRQARNMLNAVSASAIAHITNKVREGTWREADIVSGLIWRAVLDGRTTRICSSRDGKGVPFTDDFPKDIPLLKPPNARPPAHYNCRSQMEAVIAPLRVLPPHRMAVASTLTVPQRRRNFRSEAKRREGDNWRNLTERQRRRRIRDVANQWANENIGTVPPQTNYGDWLRKQPAGFQDDVLGPTRGALFRRGKLPIDKFVNYTGKTLTLDQLRARYPAEWKRAGLD